MAIGFDRLLDLLLPGRCVSCDRPGGLICEGCGEPLSSMPRVVWPSPIPPGLPVPYAVADYDGAVRMVLREYKEQGLTMLRDPLAHALALSAAAAAQRDRTGRLVLVPMPSSAAARRRRGDDPVARMARLAARRLTAAGRPTVCWQAVRQIRSVSDSAGLTSAQRRANVAGSLAVVPGLRSRSAGCAVILIDDVITTGSTLAEAAAVLRAAGTHPIGAATVAATKRRNKSDPSRDCRFAADRSTVPF